MRGPEDSVVRPSKAASVLPDRVDNVPAQSDGSLYALQLHPGTPPRVLALPALRFRFSIGWTFSTFCFNIFLLILYYFDVFGRIVLII